MKEQDKKHYRTTEANRDPLTGEPGSHPLGAGLGAAAGAVTGAAIGVAAVTAAATGAATGAVMGTAAGPLGVAAGALIGGIAGGLAGKGVAEAIDPTSEDAYWRENYKTRPYVNATGDYDAYGPAYRYGVDAYGKHDGRSFDEIEPTLSSDWDKVRGKSSLDWTAARDATRDAYSRIDERVRVKRDEM